MVIHCEKNVESGASKVIKIIIKIEKLIKITTYQPKVTK